MSVRTQLPRLRRSQPRTTTALIAAGALWLTACSGTGGESAAEADAPPPGTDAPATTPTTTAAPPTTRPARPPTTTPTTTAAPTTTLAPITTSPPSTTTTSTTTTLVVQAPTAPQPIAPPTDVYADEPVIDVGSIAIPKLDVDMTMYEGIRLSTLDYGPGHWPGTAMPGQVGNVVVGGHRTSSHRVFRNVDQLVAGDEIIFRDDAGEHTYHVNRVEIVDPTAIWIVDPTETATATLFACHPPGSTTQRIVVFADLAESTQG
ncbi:sortase [Ilumatobacter sp.]|uniref:sortase n=1 Tax=Ilumatobacter sp. TaxID=1967498 RepID=UPI003AF8B821